MKHSIILSIACILFAATSCSMENDVMNDVTKAVDNSKETTAYISVKVQPKAINTKSGSVLNGEEADVIDHCSVIIVDAAGNVSAAFDNLYANAYGKITTIDADDAEQTLIPIKVSKDDTNIKVRVLIVANSSKKFGNIKTLALAQAVIQQEADLNTWVKISELEEITIAQGYMSTSDASANPYSTGGPIMLYQMAARIELSEFNVSFKAGTKPAEVRIENMRLENQNIASITKLNDETAASFTTATVAAYADAAIYTVAGGALYNKANPIKFNSFPNTNKDKTTALCFTMVYDREDGTTTKDFRIVINRQADDKFTNGTGHIYVKAGYIYRLIINATELTSNNIDCNVVCYTKDWVFNKLSIIY